MIRALTLSFFILCTAFSLVELRQQQNLQISNNHKADQEVLYLPNGVALELISFGYKNFLSDILWFNTINYFGKHYSTDRSYEWLFHMCSLVLDLNPKLKHVYKFCGTMIAWEVNLPDRSISILSRAIENYPNDWEFYYLRGFSYLFFLKNEEKAKSDLVRAAELPGAPFLVQRLAAKKLAATDPETAIEFLDDRLMQAQDPKERKALEDRRKEALLERDLQRLKRALAIYKERTGRDAKNINDLRNAGIIAGELRDPYNGEYIIDPDTGLIDSTTKGSKTKTAR